MEPEHQITFGPFRLEGTPGRLWRGDQVIPLRSRSLALLRYLAAHPGRLVTKVEVLQQVMQIRCSIRRWQKCAVNGSPSHESSLPG
jgi:DNA-binding winged helix-turn-helix (wHTH) protein